MYCLFWAFVVVGGIYTVIKTKAGVTVDELGEQYCLIGPYNDTCVRTEVEIMEPYSQPMQRSIQHMRDHGIKVRPRKTLPASQQAQFDSQNIHLKSLYICFQVRSELIMLAKPSYLKPSLDWAEVRVYRSTNRKSLTK